MRAKLKVQEQIVDAILKKNLSYVDNELRSLKNVDYKTFAEAERWLKNAKVRLDNFQANNDNPNYIAFDMLTNAKQAPNDDFMNAAEDNLLDEDENKPMDIIAQGERIADVLGKVKTMNVNILASQLSQLSLEFNQNTIDALKDVADCKAIEGVEVSPEELDALKEAADANAGLENDADELKKDFENMKIRNSEIQKS